MISVHHRFHGYNSLKSTYNHGQTIRSSFISLKFASRQSGQPYRAAVVVSRKVHKSAVVRNRIRRRMYEIIRQADEPLTEHKDLVFTVFSEQVAGMPHAKLATTVENLLQKTQNRSVNRPQTPVKHDIVNKYPSKEAREK